MPTAVTDTHCSQVGWGPALLTSVPAALMAKHNKTAHAIHRGNTPGALGSNDQERLCFWAPQDTHITSLLQDWEM